MTGKKRIIIPKLNNRRKRILDTSVARRMIFLNIVMAVVSLLAAGYWYINDNDKFMILMLLLGIFFATGILRYRKYIRNNT